MSRRAYHRHAFGFALGWAALRADIDFTLSPVDQPKPKITRQAPPTKYPTTKTG